MALQKLISFTKDVSDFADQPTGNASDIKAQFDAAPNELRTYMNNNVDAIKSTASGDSGAKNIGVTTNTNFTGNDVQTVLENVAGRVKTFEAPIVLQYPTLLNGWVDNVSGEPSHYYKDGSGTVFFYFYVKNGSTANNVVIANLPVGYRPLSNLGALRGYGDVGVDVLYHVTTGGEIKFIRTFSITTGNFIILHGSYKGA